MTTQNRAQALEILDKLITAAETVADLTQALAKTEREQQTLETQEQTIPPATVTGVSLFDAPPKPRAPQAKPAEPPPHAASQSDVMAALLRKPSSAKE